MKTAPIQLKMREQRLRWYGHVLRRPENHPVRLALDFEAPGKRPRGASRKRWKDVIKRDLGEVGATTDDALDRKSKGSRRIPMFGQFEDSLLGERQKMDADYLRPTEEAVTKGPDAVQIDIILNNTLTE
ncbi:unnamed protein product [Heligmosomoides polygyrus]|uniref:Ribosome biogenesis regulatory protein n=1 Tax=Heligmosomoides polygyrus TaxID=6339 RepID=A0A183FZB2_HELPZ|nr:unnamed protein product [Heligmosomoides polygyrus]